MRLSNLLHPPLLSSAAAQRTGPQAGRSPADSAKLQEDLPVERVWVWALALGLGLGSGLELLLGPGLPSASASGLAPPREPLSAAREPGPLVCHTGHRTQLLASVVCRIPHRTAGVVLALPLVPETRHHSRRRTSHHRCALLHTFRKIHS